MTQRISALHDMKPKRVPFELTQRFAATLLYMEANSWTFAAL